MIKSITRQANLRKPGGFWYTSFSMLYLCSCGTYVNTEKDFWIWVNGVTFCSEICAEKTFPWIKNRLPPLEKGQGVNIADPNGTHGNQGADI